MEKESKNMPESKNKKDSLSEPKQSETQSEQSKSVKQLTKDELKQQMSVEYNLLLAKINMANLGESREVSLAITNLEQSFLWFACAVDKFELK